MNSATKKNKTARRKAERLLEMLQRVQSSIYNFQYDMAEKGLGEIAQACGDAGFEIDISKAKMQKAIQLFNK